MAKPLYGRPLTVAERQRRHKAKVKAQRMLVDSDAFQRLLHLVIKEARRRGIEIPAQPAQQQQEPAA